MIARLHGRSARDDGASTVEYALLIALIARRHRARSDVLRPAGSRQLPDHRIVHQRYARVLN